MKIKHFAEWGLDDFFDRETELDEEIAELKLMESALRYKLITALEVGSYEWGETCARLFRIKRDREGKESNLKFIEEQRREYFGLLGEEPPAAVGT